MQMADRKLYLGDRPQNFSVRQIERIDQIDKLPPVSQNIVNYLSVANELQMVGRKHYLSDCPKNSLFAK